MPTKKTTTIWSWMKRDCSMPTLASVWAMSLAACSRTARYSAVCLGAALAVDRGAVRHSLEEAQTDLSAWLKR